MEAYNLQYLPHFAVLLCRDHGYCLRPSSYDRHLRSLHAAKGDLLCRATKEIKNLPRFYHPSNINNPAAGGAPIPGLAIADGLRCMIDHCGFITRATDEMEKHQSKLHAVGRLKTYPRTTDMSTTVSFQSFFPKPFFRPFAVDNLRHQEQNTNAPTIASSAVASDNSTRSSSPRQDLEEESLEEGYTRSQQEWQQGFARFAQSASRHESQTPPWLNTTGITAFIRRLDLTKAEIQELIHPEDQDVEASTASYLVQQCVLHRLTECREMCLAGSSSTTVNRPTLRALNTFEANRAHTTPFSGVQELHTLNRYAGYWGRLILFLINVGSSQRDTVLGRLLFDHTPSLHDQVQAVAQAAGRLHEVNGDESDFASCLRLTTEDARSQDSSSDQDFDISDHSHPRRMQARQLLHAVNELSVALVRQEYEADAFRCGVLGFVALHAVNRQGAWIAGANYAPILSCMIHCMQLWLLGACVAECGDSSGHKALQTYTEAQCRRFLVNTNSCPIADLSFWRLETWSARNDSVRAPSTTVSPDCMQVIHHSVVLTLPTWREALQQLVHQASCVLEQELLFDLREAPRYPLKNLRDHFGDSIPGHCFLDEPTNELHTVKDWLYQRMRANPDLQSRFYQAGRARQSTIDIYLHAHQRFLRLLAVLMYWTSGLPPRRKELIGIAWCNQEFPRNILIHHGFVVIVTSYHKSQWKIGNRPVARVLAPEVGDLLIRYLIYIPPWIRFLSRCTQPSAQAVASDGLRGYLFASAEGIWTADQWGGYFKRQSAASLGFPITTRQWRHMAIALDRTILQGMGCQTYGVSEKFGRKPLHAAEGSDSEWDVEDHDPGATGHSNSHAIHHQQAAHTSTTNVTSYGNSSNMSLGLTDTLLAAFMTVSRKWHDLCGMRSGEPATEGQKRPLSASAASVGMEKRLAIRSQVAVRRLLWTWPALEQALQKLLGANARPRNIQQRHALALTARSRPETLIVMPTGSGKTLVYVVPTLLPMAQVTAVVLPLVAARVDLLRRCQQWGLDATIYRPGVVTEHQLHAITSLLLVDVDLAVTGAFAAVLQALQNAGRLDRLVIDEAHLILTAAHYRENLGSLGVLRRVGCPMVCLTATLPPVAERDLKQSLHFTQTETLRVGSDRPNLQYRIQHLSSDTSSDEALVEAAVEICRNDIRQWIREAGPAPVTARGICYVREKSLGLRLARELHAEFYHAGLDVRERDRIWSAWSDGQTAPVMVATSALGLGVDYPFVRRVLHLDAPSGMVDYGQETGRAGRDGLHAVCTILLPQRWSVSWNKGYRSDFLTEDCKQMTRYLQSRQCLRFLLTAYLDGWIDGRHGVTCGADPTRCSFCGRAAGQAAGTTRSPTANQGRFAPVQEMTARSPKAVSNRFAPLQEMGPLQEMDDSADESAVSTTSGAIDAPNEASSMEFDSESNSVQSVTDEPGAMSESARRDEQDVYDVASNLSHSTVMDQECAYNLYESRVVRWGRMCIPCSFTHAVAIEGPHADCIRELHATSLQDLRCRIPFAKYIACWSCGQPQFICPNRGRGNCKQPDLLWHVCWTACSLDTRYGARIIESLGGPTVEINPDVRSKQGYIRWLGGRSELFKLPVSNAARLTYQWLDRLEDRCSP